VGILLEYSRNLHLIAGVLLLCVTLAATCALLAGRRRQLALDDQGQLVTRHET
jgi:CP family cyanate transporter-like MFS transporter